MERKEISREFGKSGYKLVQIPDGIVIFVHTTSVFNTLVLDNSESRQLICDIKNITEEI